MKARCLECKKEFTYRGEPDEDPHAWCPTCYELVLDHTRAMTESSCIGCHQITGYCVCEVQP